MKRERLLSIHKSKFLLIGDASPMRKLLKDIIYQAQPVLHIVLSEHQCAILGLQEWPEGTTTTFLQSMKNDLKSLLCSAAKRSTVFLQMMLYLLHLIYEKTVFKKQYNAFSGLIARS